MKKQLQKKFSAFIVTSMMISATVNAQIVYTDVIPDLVIDTTGNVYALDMNNDGTIDFNLSFTKSIVSSTRCSGTRNSYSVKISPADSILDNVANLSYAGINYPPSINKDTLIDSTGYIWGKSASQILVNVAWYCSGRGIPFSYNWRSTMTGKWNAATDKYLGLRFKVGSNTYYGWLWLTVGNGSYTIKGYAYNSIPNQPILAGDTGSVTTGISENSIASSINLFPNPAKNHLTIDLGSNNKKVELTIADITGKVIYTTTANETNMIEVNTSEFAAGIYIVRIQASGFVGTKKLVLER